MSVVQDISPLTDSQIEAEILRWHIYPTNVAGRFMHHAREFMNTPYTWARGNRVHGWLALSDAEILDELAGEWSSSMFRNPWLYTVHFPWCSVYPALLIERFCV